MTTLLESHASLVLVGWEAQGTKEALGQTQTSQKRVVTVITEMSMAPFLLALAAFFSVGYEKDSTRTYFRLAILCQSNAYSPFAKATPKGSRKVETQCFAN